MTATNITFNFTTRDEYKTFVEQWKADYKQLSEDIRKAKTLFRAAHSHYDRTPYSDRLARSKSWIAISNARNSLDDLKRQARSMLQLRADAKVEAQRQYVMAKLAESLPV